MEIIPAIIPKNFEDLEEKMSNVLKLVPLVQIDVLDGSLANLRAWPYQAFGKPDVSFESIVREDEGFPFWQDMEFEAHFMVREPERLIPDWIAAGVARIIIQIEGTSDLGKSLKEIDKRVLVGVALALDTPNEVLKPFKDDVEVIQCMGWEISNLGRQGEALDEKVFEKIRQLRQEYPEHIISIDGGVNLENAEKLLEAGADKLVVGSALWKDDKVRENWAKFKSLI
jgi:ribulose-phosphate 3-epimerase